MLNIAVEYLYIVANISCHCNDPSIFKFHILEILEYFWRIFITGEYFCRIFCNCRIFMPNIFEVIMQRHVSFQVLFVSKISAEYCKLSPNEILIVRHVQELVSTEIDSNGIKYYLKFESGFIISHVDYCVRELISFCQKNPMASI